MSDTKKAFIYPLNMLSTILQSGLFSMHYEYNSKKEKATAKKEKNKPAITQWERELYQV